MRVNRRTAATTSSCASRDSLFQSTVPKYGFRGALNAVQLIWAGVFDRFPTLQVYFAETQMGWIPNFLEQMDNHYKRHRHWAERLLGLQPLAHLPSDYVRQHC